MFRSIAPPLPFVAVQVTFERVVEKVVEVPVERIVARDGPKVDGNLRLLAANDRRTLKK